MKRILAYTVAALFLLLLLTGVPAQADDRGHVKEVIVKIETKDGPKWFKLGKDLSPAEFREGDAVQFNYADDGTIQSIAVDPKKDAPGDSKKKMSK